MSLYSKTTGGWELRGGGGVDVITDVAPSHGAGGAVRFGRCSESSQQAPTTEELDFFFLLYTFYVGRDSEMETFISYRLVLTLECILNLLF